jgi:hypothetical protein
MQNADCKRQKRHLRRKVSQDEKHGTLPFALFLKLQVTTPSDQNVAAGEHVCLVAG